MKIFFDTEFTGLHQHTTLISLGAVAENGEAFYAEFNDFDKKQVTPWIEENVLAHLMLMSPAPFTARDIIEDNNALVKVYGDTKYIKDRFLQWLSQFDSVEFWSDVLPYDWVLLQELIGDYSSGYPKLPGNVYYIPFDIATLMKIKGVDPDINRETFAAPELEQKLKSFKHNALHDAIVIKACYERLMKM